MALHLALICSAEQLFPHDSVTNLVLGVNVVAAAERPVSPGDLDRNWLEPWRWDSVSAVKVRASGTAQLGPFDLDVSPISLVPLPGGAAPQNLTAAKNALERRYNELSRSIAPFAWDPNDPGAPPPREGFHRAVVGAASTLSGPLAHALNLAFTVRIPWASLSLRVFATTHADPRENTFVSDLKLYVAPVIRRGAATITPANAAPTLLAGWTCTSTGGAPPAKVFTVPVKLIPHPQLAASESRRYYRLSSYWVGEPWARGTSIAAADVGENWTTRLADRIADAWNLPRHIVDAFSSTNMSVNEFKELWRAILAAVRDRAGAGVENPPEGRSLLRFAADSVVAASASPRVREARIESLRAQIAAWDRTVTLKNWHDLLLELGLAGAQLPLEPSVPPMRSIAPAALEPLAHLINALEDDATLARVVWRQWDRGARDRVQLASASISVPAYTARHLRVTATTPTFQASWPETGILNLTGRDAVAVTLAEIELYNGAPIWLAGPKYELRITNGDPTGASAVILEVTYGVVGPNNDPKLDLSLRVGASRPVLGTVTLPAGTACHGLRLKFSPATRQPIVAVAVRWAAASNWHDVVQAALPLSLTRASLQMRYVPGGFGGSIIASHSAVLSTPPTGFTQALTEWDALGIDPVQALWNEIGDALRANLADMKPRRQLARIQTSRLWPVWNFDDEIQPDPMQYLSDRLEQYLKNAPAQRFGWATAVGLYDDRTPPAAITEAGLRSRIDAHMDRAARVLKQPGRILPWRLPAGLSPAVPLQQAPDLVPTATPHGWSFAVDRPAVFQETTLGEDDDLTRRVAGVGVLLRQANPAAANPFTGQPWRVLNVADIYGVTSVDANGNVTRVRSARRSTLPVRGRFADDVRQTVMTYDNQPLVAADPLAGVSTALGTLAERHTSGEAFGPFQFEPATRDQGGTDVFTDPLPTLKFGQFYELLPYLVGNNGALPLPLADAHPSVLTATIPDVPSGGTGFIRRLRYLRRVQPGTPRVAEEVLNEFLNIPKNVLPLARELGLRALSAAWPSERFFFDVTRAQGQLAISTDWAVALPRLLAAGVPHADPREAQWGIAFGLRDDERDGVINGEMVAKVSRNGNTLSAIVMVNGVAQLRTTSGLPTAGAIDLKLEWQNTTTTLALNWRVSDADAPWVAVGTWTRIAPSLPHSYVVVEQNGGAVPPVFGPPVFMHPSANAGSPWHEAPAPLPETPLAMFRDVIPRTATSFDLRPPATDFATWARWYDMDVLLGQGTAAIRQEVWEDYHEKLPRPATQQSEDISLDDPAVAGVMVELVPLLVESPDAIGSPIFLRRRTTQQTKPGIRHVRSAGWTVTIDQATGATRLEADGGTGVIIHVRSKEIWSLRIYPLIANALFDDTSIHPGVQRFHSKFGPGPTVTQSGTVYRVFPAWRLDLEVATRDVIQLSDSDRTSLSAVGGNPEFATALIGWSSVRPKFDGQSAGVSLDKQSRVMVPVPSGSSIALDGDPWRFRYVASVRLRRQVWRWRGRPVPPFPFTAQDRDAFPTSTDTEFTSLMLWDASGFGDRSAIDLLEESRGVNATTVLAELFRENVKDDPRTLYYRFSPQFESRYAGLYDDCQLELLATQYRYRASDLDRSPWRRLLVPCRQTATVPRPSVHFVVPMTESIVAQNVRATPGLLVVVDEPAYAIGGLAETLEATMVRMDDPTPPQVTRPEFGPDPVLRGQGWTQQAHGGTGDHPPAIALPLDIDGPIGHTFDTGADAPLYGASSFVLQAPDVTPIQHDADLAWYFAKIRFRRLLLPEGTAAWSTPLPLSSGVYNLGNDPGDRAINIHGIRPAVDSTRRIRLRNGVGTVLRTVSINRTAANLTISYDDPPASTTLVESGGGVTIDIRFILQETSSPSGSLVRSITVSYRASGVATDRQRNRWRTLQSADWPDGLDWPVQALVDDPLTEIQVHVQPARISVFTPPYWVQFLPNAALLLPEGAAHDTIHWQSDDTFVFERDGVARDWKLGLSSVWPPASEQSESTFIRRVLLTEVVHDARGQLGQERYLGLYEPDNLGILTRLHRSPALAPDEKERELSEVRVRVVEFQEDKARSGLLRSPHDAWAVLFDPPSASADDSRLADAPARVVSVSPPVQLRTIVS